MYAYGSRFITTGHPSFIMDSHNASMRPFCIHMWISHLQFLYIAEQTGHGYDQARAWWRVAWNIANDMGRQYVYRDPWDDIDGDWIYMTLVIRM